MLFNSLTFLVFFVAVYGLYWAIPGWSAKKWLLLLASYVFYAAWNPPYILVLAFSTMLDWWLARRIAGATTVVNRRFLLVLSLVGNLGLLSYFKYGNFVLENFQEILAWLGYLYPKPAFSITLPIGISFYTFASLSYTIDVYRKDIKADCRFSDYALFVSFFPHLVAGPIVRASYLLPQIENPKLPTADQIGWGAAWVVMGLFAKTVLADGLLAPMVDAYYAKPAGFPAIEAWIAVLAFSGQIYFDFSGYSLCAIGLAMSFGFLFPDNFRHPFAARGFADFWRRWHMSLSIWLRDYLYIPLGGNRQGELRTCANIGLTMLIGGLWHGASWMFVLWGGLHGLFLIAERLLRGKRSNVAGPAYGFLEVCTFLAVSLAWIPFRVATPDAAATVARSLVANWQASSLAWPSFESLMALAVMLLTLRWHAALRDSSLKAWFVGLGFGLQTSGLALCLIGIFLFSGESPHAFIYFQF